MKKQFKQTLYVALSALSVAVLAGAQHAAVQTGDPLTKPEGAAPAEELADGTFTGEAAYLATGPVQVTIEVADGRIVDVQATYPTGNRHSHALNTSAVIELREATLASQDAELDLVTGATFTSLRYIDSLQSALDQARP